MGDFSSKHIMATWPLARMHEALPEHHKDAENEWSKILLTAKMNKGTHVPMKVFDQQKRSKVQELNIHTRFTIRTSNCSGRQTHSSTTPSLAFALPGSPMLSRRSMNQVFSLKTQGTTDTEYRNKDSVRRDFQIDLGIDILNYGIWLDWTT